MRGRPTNLITALFQSIIITEFVNVRRWGISHDDLIRVRSGSGPGDIVIVRHIALNMLSQATPSTCLRDRRKRPTWDPDNVEQMAWRGGVGA